MPRDRGVFGRLFLDEVLFWSVTADGTARAWGDIHRRIAAGDVVKVRVMATTIEPRVGVLPHRVFTVWTRSWEA